MWEARAEYDDGTSYEGYFESNPYKYAEDERYELEEMLLTRHEGCTWYSVNWIYE